MEGKKQRILDELNAAEQASVWQLSDTALFTLETQACTYLNDEEEQNSLPAEPQLDSLFGQYQCQPQNQPAQVPYSQESTAIPSQWSIPTTPYAVKHIQSQQQSQEISMWPQQQADLDFSQPASKRQRLRCIYITRIEHSSCRYQHQYYEFTIPPLSLILFSTTAKTLYHFESATVRPSEALETSEGYPPETLRGPHTLVTLKSHP